MTSNANTSATKPAKPAKPAKVTVESSPAVFNAAVRSATAAASRAAGASWVIGDNADKVQKRYGKDKLSQFADAIGWELPTVRNLRTMAARYPVADIARDLQPVTVYGVFASQDDRFDLIRNGNDGQPWSLSAARALIKSRNTAISPDGDGDGNGDSDGNGESDADKLARLRLRRDQLAAELAKVDTDIVALEAKVNAPKTTARKRTPKVHAVAGVPSHTEDQPDAACPTCQATARKNGVSLLPVADKPAPRRSRNQRAAA